MIRYLEASFIAGLQPDGAEGAGCFIGRWELIYRKSAVLLVHGSISHSSECAMGMPASSKIWASIADSSARIVFLLRRLLFDATPLPSMPRAPRTPSAASPARSRSCDSRTPRECDRDIVGSYTHRRFRHRPSFQICFACVIRSHHCEVANLGNCS